MRVGIIGGVRALLLVFGSFGLLLGLLCASLAPHLVGFGWFAYTPLADDTAFRSTLRIDLDWSPLLLIMPGAGLALGLLLAVVLHLGRWRLSRS